MAANSAKTSHSRRDMGKLSALWHSSAPRPHSLRERFRALLKILSMLEYGLSTNTHFCVSPPPRHPAFSTVASIQYAPA